MRFLGGLVAFAALAQAQTIYQIIQSDPRFSRLLKALDFEEETAKVLNDNNLSLTFFAPDNEAIPRPPRRRHGHDNAFDFFEDAMEDDDEEKKKILKKIIGAILEYSTIATGRNAEVLAQNTTHPTRWVSPGEAVGAQPSRLRTSASAFPPALYINGFAKVKSADIVASNGVLHVLSVPIWPPPSAFEQLFWVQPYFSTVTSALGRVGLDDAFEYRYHWQSDENQGWSGSGKSITAFVPTSLAFARLPGRLRAFLFSPIGERALAKLLAFHAAPAYVLHADWSFNATSGEKEDFFPSSQIPLGSSHRDAHMAALSAASDYAPFAEGMQAELDYAEIAEEFEHIKEATGFDYDKWLTVDDEEAFDDEEEFDPSTRSHPRALPLAPRPPHHPPHKRPAPPPGKAIFSKSATLPSLLPNHTLHVHVARFASRLPKIPNHPAPPPETKVWVNGVPVVFADGVARNGAVHVVGRLLNPFRRHRKEGEEDVWETEEGKEWEEWEEWLPAWAME